MRWSGFFLLALAYVLVFFHRMAPAIVAPDLQAAFAVDATRLGILAASYYYVYTLMQPLSGLAADMLGPRLAVGLLGLVGGVGSIIFGLAESFAVASIGRLLVGLGVAFVFIGLMKYNSVWFHHGVYGRVSGFTLLLGNLGAVLASGPLAAVLGFASWRTVFVALGVIAILLSLAILLFVRLPAAHEHHRKPPWHIFRVAGIRWGALAMFGTVGNVFAFAGLWSLPLLQDRFGLNRDQASVYITALMLALAFGALSAGWISDHLGRRRPLAITGAAMLVAGFTLLALTPWSLGLGATLIFVVLGLGGGWVSVIFANAKELSGAASAGFGISMVNTGLFLGAAVMQSLFGLVLDVMDPAAAGSGYDAEAWRWGLLCSAAVAALGLFAATRLTDSGPALVAASPVHSAIPLRA